MADWIFGRNPVAEAIKSERDIHKILVAEGSQQGSMQPLIKKARDRGITVQTVPRKKIDYMYNGQHQGVAAQIAAYDYVEVEDLLEVAVQRGETPFIVLLDELEDPHNLGSILRTCDAVGAHGVIIPKRRAVGLTATVAKASTGAIEHIRVARVTNLSRTIDDLKSKGVWIVGTDASANEDYRQMDGGMSLGLVIGSEGKGMSRLVKEQCDFLVSLPMKGEVTSLNASVAAALLMYEVYRKRQPLGE